MARVATYTFHDTHARLSLAFAEGEAWKLYLSSVVNAFRTLENAHGLIPENTTILEAILYLCDRNPQRLPYVWRGSGQIYWRELPPGWTDRIREKKQFYSEKLYTLDPSKRPTEAVTGATQGIRSKGQSLSIVIGAIVVIGFIVAVAVVVNQNDSVATNSATNPTGKFPGPANEKAYLEASGRYLNVHFENCKSASVTMAGASDGSSSLSDIRVALQEARSKINQSWETDFLPVSNGSVPEKFADVDKKLRRVHALQEDAFSELLKYWKDDHLSHINNGSTKFKQALLECDSAIKDLNRILDSYKAH